MEPIHHTQLNWADIVLISIILVSVLISLIRGFVREVLSLLIWIFAFWLALSFYEPVAEMLSSYLEATPSVRIAIAFIGLLIGALSLGALLSYLISKLIKKTGFSGTDRLIGIFFGAARGLLLVTVLILLLKMTPLTRDPWWSQSSLIPYFDAWSETLKEIILEYWDRWSPLEKNEAESQPVEQNSTQ